MPNSDELPCKEQPCKEPRVAGSEYCEDHLLEKQVQARRPKPVGTLAGLIRQAKSQGLITPTTTGGYPHN